MHIQRIDLIEPGYLSGSVVFGRKKASAPEEKTGFVKKLRARLNRGNSWLTYDLANLAPDGKIDEDVLEDLEAELVMADVGGKDFAKRLSTFSHRSQNHSPLRPRKALLSS
jgi:fused signal recognition particle receptor